jgi:hypothetical protein
MSRAVGRGSPQLTSFNRGSPRKDDIGFESENVNPFATDGSTGALLFDELGDKMVSEFVRGVIPELKANAQQSQKLHGIHDKIDPEDMLERLAVDDEDVYDMPAMKVRVLVRSFPEIEQKWERFGLEIYQTSRHLYIFDTSSDFVNGFDTMLTKQHATLGGPAGFLELSRYQIDHHRADDMLVIPLPLTHIKGFELDMHMQTSASSCSSHGRRVSMNSLFAAYGVGLGLLSLSIFGLENAESSMGTGLATVGFSIAIIMSLLRYNPTYFNSTHVHVSEEVRQVQIGATDPLTKHHMVLAMTLDESYPTDAAKEVAALAPDLATRYSMRSVC